MVSGMDMLQFALQVIVAFGLLNVWLLRANRPTRYRGRGVGSLQQEFAAYGLSVPVMRIVGALKIGVALALLLGLWITKLVTPAAVVLTGLMLGAFIMHLKVKDPWARSLPSLLMLGMAVTLVVLGGRSDQ